MTMKIINTISPWIPPPQKNPQAGGYRSLNKNLFSSIKTKAGRYLLRCGEEAARNGANKRELN